MDTLKCERCGDILVGHEDEAWMVCRWCNTGWKPAINESSEAAYTPDTLPSKSEH